ncbi:MAG: hypothetical protein ABI317_15010 [Gaiellales bacterium]
MNDPPPETDIAVRAALSERLVSSFPGRRMHLELSLAELHGGGRIAGRVHRDRGAAPGALVARVRCIESWRVSPRPGRWLLMSRTHAIPVWRQVVCSEQAAELEPFDDSHWRGFSFDIPTGLPPAVEARTVAWRYEVEVRRSVRFGPDDRAMLTPLGSVGALHSTFPRTDPGSIRAGARRY